MLSNTILSLTVILLRSEAQQLDALYAWAALGGLQMLLVLCWRRDGFRQLCIQAASGGRPRGRSDGANADRHISYYNILVMAY